MVAQPYDSIDYSREDIRQQFYDFLERIGGDALAPGTRSYYDRHRFNYESHCQAMGLRAWPPTFRALRSFFGHHLYTGHSINTLSQIKSALKHYHLRHPQYRHLPFLLPSDELALKDFTRSAHRFFPTEVKRKRPLTLDILSRILLISDTTSPKIQMFLTMAFVSHNALLRFSELANLQVQNVYFDHAAQVVRLRLVNTKAAPGTIQNVSLCMIGKVSGAALLSDYWVGRQLHLQPRDTPLFQYHHPISTSRFKFYFVQWIRAQLNSLGLVGKEFSGHSFRSGGATDMFRQRLPPRMIKEAGRWKSDVYMIYCRDHPDTAAAIVQAAFDRIIAEAYRYRPH